MTMLRRLLAGLSVIAAMTAPAVAESPILAAQLVGQQEICPATEMVRLVCGDRLPCLLPLDAVLCLPPGKAATVADLLQSDLSDPATNLLARDRRAPYLSYKLSCGADGATDLISTKPGGFAVLDCKRPILPQALRADEARLHSGTDRFKLHTPPQYGTLGIAHAQYRVYPGAPGCDVTQPLRNACDGKPSCVVPVNDTLCGASPYGMDGILLATYYCIRGFTAVTRTTQQSFDGSYPLLSCDPPEIAPKTPRITVKAAHYMLSNDIMGPMIDGTEKAQACNGESGCMLALDRTDGLRRLTAEKPDTGDETLIGNIAILYTCEDGGVEHRKVGLHARSISLPCPNTKVEEISIDTLSVQEYRSLFVKYATVSFYENGGRACSAYDYVFDNCSESGDCTLNFTPKACGLRRNITLYGFGEQAVERDVFPGGARYHIGYQCYPDGKLQTASGPVGQPVRLHCPERAQGEAP